MGLLQGLKQGGGECVGVRAGSVLQHQRRVRKGISGGQHCVVLEITRHWSRWRDKKKIAMKAHGEPDSDKRGERK